MNPRHHRLPCLALLTIAAPAFAQPPSTPKLELSQPLPAAEWLVPVHTQAADPVGGEYGIWAAGPTYKVSFHDGYRFFPVLGTTYPQNLPFHWRTTSIKRG